MMRVPIHFFAADLWGDSCTFRSPFLRLHRQHAMAGSSEHDRGVVPDPLHSGDLHHIVSHKPQVPERQVCFHALCKGTRGWDWQWAPGRALGTSLCPIHSHRLRGWIPCG